MFIATLVVKPLEAWLELVFSNLKHCDLVLIASGRLSWSSS